MELCLGQNPFGAVHVDAEAAQMLTQIQQAMPHVLDTLTAHWTPMDFGVLVRCLHADPEQRPDIEELVHSLRLY